MNLPCASSRNEFGRIPRPGHREHVCGRLVLSLCLLFAFQIAGLGAAEPGGDPAAPGDLYARLKQASVEVLVDDHLNGSGSLIAADGLVITAAHVIGRPGVRVEVLSPVAGRRKAEVVAVDLGHDLALLRAEPRDGGYPFLPVSDALPPPGTEVYLLGTPIFRHAVLFRGTVACEEPSFEHLNPGYVAVTTLAATAPSGTSGGPWVDRHGGADRRAERRDVEQRDSRWRRLCGVPGWDPPLAGNAAECVHAQPGCGRGRDLAAGPRCLGPLPAADRGLIVKVLQADGPAARGGLKQFDLIVASDGQAVRLPAELLRLVRQKKPGESVALSVLGPDGTGKREVTVTLGRLEIGWPEPK
jgi:S1-C subfamily serine protease